VKVPASVSTGSEASTFLSRLVFMEMLGAVLRGLVGADSRPLLQGEIEFRQALAE